METTLRVVLQTPDKVFFDGQADWVRIETEGGELEIHPKHVSAMGSVIFAPVRIHHDDKLLTYYVRQGVMRVDNEENAVFILGFSCEKEEEISETSIKGYMDFILDKLENDEDLSDIQITYLKEQQVSLEKLLQVSGGN